MVPELLAKVKSTRHEDGAHQRAEMPKKSEADGTESLRGTVQGTDLWGRAGGGIRYLPNQSYEQTC